MQNEHEKWIRTITDEILHDYVEFPLMPAARKTIACRLQQALLMGTEAK